MSILNYMVVADPTAAREIAENFLSDKFVWHDFCWLAFDCGVFNDLECLLSGRPPIQEVLQSEDELPMPPMLYDGGGHWVYLVPDEWVKLVAKIEVEGIPELTRRLVEVNLFLGQELDQDGLIPNIEQQLKDLRDVCNQAITSKTALLLYLSE